MQIEVTVRMGNVNEEPYFNFAHTEAVLATFPDEMRSLRERSMQGDGEASEEALSMANRAIYTEAINRIMDRLDDARATILHQAEQEGLNWTNPDPPGRER